MNDLTRCFLLLSVSGAICVTLYTSLSWIIHLVFFYVGFVLGIAVCDKYIEKRRK